MTNPHHGTVIKNPTWWRRRTHLERSLLVMCIVSTVVATALFVSLAVLNLRGQAEKAKLLKLNEASDMLLDYCQKSERLDSFPCCVLCFYGERWHI